MREIKFRGKNVDLDSWVYGGYHKHLKCTPCPMGDNVKPNDIEYLIIESGFSPQFGAIYDMAANMIFSICEVKGNIYENPELLEVRA